LKVQSLFSMTLKHRIKTGTPALFSIRF